MPDFLIMDAVDLAIINISESELVSGVGSRIVARFSGHTRNYVAVAHALGSMSHPTSRRSRIERQLRSIQKLSDMTPVQLMGRVAATLAKCKFNAGTNATHDVILMQHSANLPGKILAVLEAIKSSMDDPTSLGSWPNSRHSYTMHMYTTEYMPKIYVVDDLMSLMMAYTTQCLAVETSNVNLIRQLPTTHFIGGLATYDQFIPSIDSRPVEAIFQSRYTRITDPVSMNISHQTEDLEAGESSVPELTIKKPRRGICRTCLTPKFSGYTCLVCGTSPRR